jgi:hypothetical protein
MNQEIIHSQRGEPLLEFPEDPVYLPIHDPYASPTQVELAAFAASVSHAPAPITDNNNDEEEANDDEETKDDE